mmetsp:Transcript_17313/g.54393  ORF Transcript_17313/g.54393 Transcript_17313/m.54393 type:complete len:452 (+) Transcript_17313:84-1439(+)
MVSAAVFAIATGIGLLTDKYMLQATNFVEDYTTAIRPSDSEKEFIKSAMYAGAIFGMVTFGPISDFAGRRACLIACSAITFLGAALSTGAWSARALIAARIITGIGMGGEYPLASSHSAESASDSGNGSRNVALLYLFGNGAGPVLCGMVTLLLDISPMPRRLVWRSTFGVGALLSLLGLVLRVVTTHDSPKLVEATKRGGGANRKALLAYWRPLLGTALIWLLFDIVEYGLKQNDKAIFSDTNKGPQWVSILKVLLSRVLVIPSLAVAPWMLTKLASKRVQMIGFVGCCCANTLFSLFFAELKKQDVLFVGLYVVQLSFQSFPGVTTMAIPAQIYPSSVRGTAAAISAACGKVGATIGSYYFTKLHDEGELNEIFWVVAGSCLVALILTMVLTPLYNGATLDAAERLAHEGKNAEAVAMLYDGPQGLGMSADEDSEDVDTSSSSSRTSDE